MKRTTDIMKSRWGAGLHLECSPMRGPQEPTEFEAEARRLGLAPEARSGSPELRRWAARWCRTRYVPEDLLKTWHLTVKE